MPVTRPWCLLDVDGVIAVQGDGPGEPIFDFFIEEMPLRVAQGTPGRVCRLAERFQLTWASSWEGAGCNDHLSPMLGLPELPFLLWRRDAGEGIFWKLPDVHAWMANRPLAWVDDELDTAAQEWGDQRDAPTLLIKPDPRLGLQDEHVERLLGFATAVEALEPVATPFTREPEIPYKTVKPGMIFRCPGCEEITKAAKTPRSR